MRAGRRGRDRQASRRALPPPLVRRLAQVQVRSRPGAGGRRVHRVGTGFDTARLRDLHARMRRIARDASPFTRGRIRERDVRWTEPGLVAQIAFTEWTRDGMLRHPRFPGLRTDKPAADVVRES